MANASVPLQQRRKIIDGSIHKIKSRLHLIFFFGSVHLCPACLPLLFHAHYSFWIEEINMICKMSDANCRCRSAHRACVCVCYVGKNLIKKHTFNMGGYNWITYSYVLIGQQKIPPHRKFKLRHCIEIQITYKTVYFVFFWFSVVAVVVVLIIRSSR